MILEPFQNSTPSMTLGVRKSANDTLEAVWPTDLALKRGIKYRWWLRPIRSGGIENEFKTEGPYTFGVLNSKDFDELLAEESRVNGDLVRLASLYLRLGLYAEAWSYLQPLYQQDPQRIDKSVYELAQRAAELKDSGER